MAEPAVRATSSSHLFLSYAAEDRDVAERLAAALEADGHAVWWDRLIAGGALWGQSIDRALADASAVVVLWSPAAVRSDYVRAEARHAAGRGVLVPVRIEPCEVPMPFGEYQTIDLAGWRATPGSGSPPELIGALRFVRDGGGVTREPGEPAHQSRTPVGALLTYATDLFQLATAPKTFLLARWDAPDRVLKAARFYVVTALIDLVIALPLARKLGGGVSWELFATALYGPLRVVTLGAVVYVALRTMGGRAGAVGTLTAFAYVHSLQLLLFEVTQGVAVGLLRAIAPAISDQMFDGLLSGRPIQVMAPIIKAQGLAATASFLALASWPLFVVPFACWGAFRIRHGLSKPRSAVAAALAIVLAILAYTATIVLSYTNAGPG